MPDLATAKEAPSRLSTPSTEGKTLLSGYGSTVVVHGEFTGVWPLAQLLDSLDLSTDWSSPWSCVG